MNASRPSAFRIFTRLPLAAAALAAALPAFAAEPTRSEKNVTIISAQASADGSSEIAREKILDCIQALPDPSMLEPLVSSEALFVQGVNGETGKNQWIKAYSARLDVTYLTRQRDLIIVTTRNVNGQPPVLREVDKTLQHTQTFVSNPAEGDLFAGRSNRQYYFSTSEGAVRDVKERARVWINQQRAVVCPAR